MIFSEATNPSKQGDIGEAAAIFAYTRAGYVVSRTLFDSASYDLLIDDGSNILRVQVKTTGYKSKYGRYRADLRVNGGNRSRSTVKKAKDGDFDILFVLSDDGRAWSIPYRELGGSSIITLGEKYDEFSLECMQAANAA